MDQPENLIGLTKAIPAWAWFFTAVTTAVALSGKTSVDIARLVLVVAWALGIVAILFMDALNGRLFLTGVSIGLLSIALIGLAIWFQPVLVTQNFGEIVGKRAFWSTSRTNNPSLEIGSSGSVFIWGGDAGTSIFNFFDESKLTIELYNGRVLVTTDIIDQEGNLTAKIERNKWKVSPTAWDRNYNDQSLEVLDAHGRVVLQVTVLSDRAQVQGEWWSAKSPGHGVRLVQDPTGSGANMVFMTPESGYIAHPPIVPIFKYPSELHFGELAN